jgi:crotonobetainyl-CoA:carnitine CoA-transferase CaiB-like acyl-CoA transferase
MTEGALSNLRICDFTGQLAGAGATKFLAAFGAQVIRIEDPTKQGRWDILRGGVPFVDERRGIDLGGAFNNHNVEKLGITLNLKTERGKEILAELIKVSDVVSENFASGVLTRMGFPFERMQELRSDIIYVSNCGFGHRGPYAPYKTWGPIVQAISGLTYTSGLPNEEPAGWGYSYMDHTGASYMAMAILLALVHRNRTGEGQWVDLACTDAGASLNGPALLDYTVNGRPVRREGMPNSNRSQSPEMAPHGIYACAGDDDWVAIGCRNDHDWLALVGVMGSEWAKEERFARNANRLTAQNELDLRIGEWTRTQNKFDVQQALREVGTPVAAVQKPGERIDLDPSTENFGLWPEVEHTAIGRVRADGLPVHLSETDWKIERGGPCLGEHNEQVFGDLLGLSSVEIRTLHEEGVI